MILVFLREPQKKKLIRVVDEHPHNIQEKVRVILDHFHRTGRHKIEGKGRGMVVVSSRRLCVLFTSEMRKQLSEMGNPYNCLVGFSGTVTLDGKEYTEKNLNPNVSDIPESFKLPENRLLIVAHKFQTGFDEPLLYSMYVDRKLRGLNCVQTLSRLNRIYPGKIDTFVLDFVNDWGTVQESFQPYYTTTDLESTTDPNRLYDLQSEIESFLLFTNDERDEVCRIFLDPTRRKEEIIPPLDRVVQRWRELGDQDRMDDFRSKVRTFVSLYGYISQISDFHETEWEKLYIFLRPLSKKLLGPNEPPIVDLFSSVDLEYFRLEKQYEGGISLLDEKGLLPHVFVGDFRSTEEEDELLSQIIKTVNDRFGTEFTDDDRINLQIVLQKSLDDQELDRIHKGDNSPTNKRQSFERVVDQNLVKMVNTKLEFYKKMKKDPEMESTLLHLLYREYLRTKGFNETRSVSR